MKIIKRVSDSIQKEEAHGGSGSRKVYADTTHTSGNNLDAITHGYLPGGNSFDWHLHQEFDEVMLVLKGAGSVEDEDGKYEYDTGDVFVFPADVKHKIYNPSDEEHEMIFVRVKK